VQVGIEQCVLPRLIERDAERCTHVPQRLQRARIEVDVFAHECAAEGVLELLLAPQLCGRLCARAESRTEPQSDPRRIDERAVDIECNYPTGLVLTGKEA